MARRPSSSGPSRTSTSERDRSSTTVRRRDRCDCLHDLKVLRRVPEFEPLHPFDEIDKAPEERQRGIIAHRMSSTRPTSATTRTSTPRARRQIKNTSPVPPRWMARSSWSPPTPDNDLSTSRELLPARRASRLVASPSPTW